MLFTSTTVTIKRARLVRSSLGDQTRDWDDPEIVAADVPADIQFQGTTEQTDQRKQLVNLYRCLLPVGTDVKSTDRVEWDGSDYEVDGEPAIWRSPLAGVTDHVRIVLKEVLA